ncbi:putative 3-demethylubiquinone-9 3-methyltransferase (glyoxalase superfamily) [Mycetocola sp. CAN_C7]|uniref:VOC family protein n=1 Tax=Mycetocola sp. CAN_C7 TaxID=2787724 RepID=UPI0018CBB7F1
MQKIVPCLLFKSEAEEAATFYVSVFENSAISDVSRYGEGAPFPAGTAIAVDFVLDGLAFRAINGGPDVTFTEATSFALAADEQGEIDRLWDALTAGGGEPSMCGWLKDKYGLSWQIVPPVLGELMSDPDPEKAGRVMQALLGMTKIEIAGLRAAYDG